MDKIILCVPGVWKTRTDLIEGLIKADTGYIAAGFVMTPVGGGEMVELDIRKHEPEVSAAFRATSLGRFSEEELASIDEHNMVIYALCNIKDFNSAIEAMKVGHALLKAGGLGIKVETSGVSHPKPEWLGFSEKLSADVFRAFVVTVTSERHLLSCGMHSFNQPDGIIDADIEDANYTLQTFLLYLLAEEPAITHGQTFAAAEEMETLQISKVLSSQVYPKGDIFYNPLNFWALGKF